jgi:putative glycerol-1-phosphate prenyltransferase
VTRAEMAAWRQWRHVVKLDPDRSIENEVLAAVGASGTDAILLGGTQGITLEKTNALYGRIKRLAPEIPVWQEISNTEAILDGVAGYAIPVVLNSGSTRWLIGEHANAIQKYRPFIDWSQVLVEGYLVLNSDAAVAELTGAKTDLSPDQAASFAVAGESLFKMPIIYLEYSGIYGDPAVVKEVSRALKQAHIFYGGGIDSYEKASEMGEHADTIIIGNALYRENWRKILDDTIRAVK